MGSGSLKSLRELNRLRIVDALRAEGTASRADLARRTGLSRSTVSTLVADLQRRGLIVERNDGSREGQQGRPGVLLALNPGAGTVVGVDFDHDKVRVAVADLSRTVLAEAVSDCDVDHDAAEALDTAADLVERLVAEAGVARDRVIGAGMALAGPVDHRRRMLHRSAILPGWVDVDAAVEFERRLGFPVYIDNDANLGALAEFTHGAARNVRCAAYVSVASGIGAGVIVDGQIHRGHCGTAGELGHVLVDPQGAICRCGNRGCLETVASGPALLELMRPSRGADFTLHGMVELARSGDAGCRRAIEDAGRAIGSVLAGMVNVLNPEMVVVGGDISEAGEILLAPLRASVQRAALPAATEELEVLAGALGERANLLGAVALVIAESEFPMSASKLSSHKHTRGGGARA